MGLKVRNVWNQHLVHVYANIPFFLGSAKSLNTQQLIGIGRLRGTFLFFHLKGRKVSATKYLRYPPWNEASVTHLFLAMYRGPITPFITRVIPSLKVTSRTWKWMVGIWSFPFGALARLIFRGKLAVSFRECFLLATLLGTITYPLSKAALFESMIFPTSRLVGFVFSFPWRVNFDLFDVSSPLKLVGFSWLPCWSAKQFASWSRNIPEIQRPHEWTPRIESCTCFLLRRMFTGGSLILHIDIYIYTWYPKQPFLNGCFSWMIPNLYLKELLFTKSPLNWLVFHPPYINPSYSEIMIAVLKHILRIILNNSQMLSQDLWKKLAKNIKKNRFLVGWLDSNPAVFFSKNSKVPSGSPLPVPKQCLEAWSWETSAVLPNCFACIGTYLGKFGGCKVGPY